MLLRPLHRLRHTDIFFILNRFPRNFLKLAQRVTFTFGQLRFQSARNSPRPKSFCFRVRSLVASCSRKSLRFVPASSVWFPVVSSMPRQSACLVWKSVCRVLRTRLQFQNLLARGSQSGNRNFSVHGRVRDNKHSRQIFWRVEVHSFGGFPTILNGIKGRIEDDAVCVQMRIKGARRVVSEPGRREVARQPVVLCPVFPNSSCRKSLKFTRADLTAREWASKIRSSSPIKPAMETDFGGENVKS